MAESLLARLGGSPALAARLGEKDRLAVLHLLLEWGAVDDALALLVWTPADAGDEWRVPAADALRRAGRAAEALAMAASLRAPGFVRDAQRIRGLLAARDFRSALAQAEALVAPGSGSFATRAEAWTLLGDVHLAHGSLSEAEVAFTQAGRLDAHDPTPRVGLLRAALAVPHNAADAALQARALVDERGPAALRSDELNLVAGALRAGGPAQSAALQLVTAELLERYDRAAARLRALLARAPQAAPAAAPAPHLPGAQAAPPGDQPTPPAGAIPGAREMAPAARDEIGELRVAVRQIFGHTTLLPRQADVISATRRGEDVLAVLPTGGGKSLCYQLPAYLDGGVTLVISPLVALMKDQVDQLPARLRPAAVALHSGIEPAQVQAALEGMAAGRYKLVYTAPERLRNRGFVAALRRVGLARLVVDEAHCVAVWGHDFRPDYLHIPRAHADMGAPPLLALTATAPPALRQEIATHLFGSAEARERPLSVHMADPTRPNLWLGVRQVKSEGDRRERIVSLCTTLPGAGVVYMRSRAQTEEIATALRAAGIEAAAYHAGLANRADVQERFMRDQLRVIVATVAFGMGVNKPNIRFILHGGLPTSLEAYVQEVGRAGRDGKPAVCLLLTTERDLQRAAQAPAEDAPIGLLQGVLEGVTQAVGTQRSGVLATEELALSLGADDTSVRVALSLLEEAGLVQRDYDAPRSLSIYMRKPGRSAEFARFAQTAGAAPGKPAEWKFAELAAALQWPPSKLEERLLAWQEAGHLSYYPRGRSLLVTLRARPRDAAERLQRLANARAHAHRQRHEQMVRFVRSRDCRQVVLAEALGGPARGPCGFCDSCGVALVDALITARPGAAT